MNSPWVLFWRSQKVEVLEHSSGTLIFQKKIAKLPVRSWEIIFAPSRSSFQDDLESWWKTLQEIETEVRSHPISVLRIHPYFLEADPSFFSRLTKEGYQQSIYKLGYGATYLVKTQQKDDVLLSGMEGRARTAIRRASNTKIEVEQRTDEEGISLFSELYEVTCRRAGFSPLSLGTIRDLLKQDSVALFLAKEKGEYLSGALLNLRTPVAIYWLGGSVDDRSKLKSGAAVFLHWSILRWCREHDYSAYDLGGVTLDAPEGSPKAGIRDFKKQFGGKLVSLPGTHEKVFQPIRYHCAEIIAGANRKFRGASL